MFVYSPLLLMLGEPFEIAVAGLTAILGTILLGSGVAGYLFRSLSWWQRILLIGGALLLMLPGLLTNGIGLGIGAAIALWQWSTVRQAGSKVVPRPGGEQANGDDRAPL